MDYQPPSAYYQQAEPLYRKAADVCQYGEANWGHAVRVERGISLQQAFDIANSDPNIHYFCYVKGGQMVLNASPYFDPNNPADNPLNLVQRGNGAYIRVFRHGDVVFFSGDEGLTGAECFEWLGTAPGLADTYYKQ